MIDTSIISNGSILTVRIKDLDALLAWLKQVNPEINKKIRKGLKGAAQEIVLPEARRRAGAIRRTGKFAASLSIASRRAGASYVLKSTDEAAGVKEFAHLGARYSVRANDKRRNARKMGSFPVGVPRRANPPRAMVPAVNDNVERILSRVDSVIEEAMSSYRG